MSDSTINPAAILFLIYLVSITLSYILIIFFGEFSFGDLLDLKNKWKYLLIGVSIVGIEIGYILAYRSGWNICVTGVVVNITVAILIIPIGYILFNETISIIKFTGIVHCIVGLTLINT